MISSLRAAIACKRQARFPSRSPSFGGVNTRTKKGSFDTACAWTFFTICGIWLVDEEHSNRTNARLMQLWNYRKIRAVMEKETHKQEKTPIERLIMDGKLLPPRFTDLAFRLSREEIVERRRKQQELIAQERLARQPWGFAKADEAWLRKPDSLLEKSLLGLRGIE